MRQPEEPAGPMPITDLVIQGRPTNLAHAAIGELCIIFFYGPGRLASRYPDIFDKEVPLGAVALVATAVSQVIPVSSSILD
jgi:Domain of unknown function (DUF6532)